MSTARATRLSASAIPAPAFILAVLLLTASGCGPRDVDLSTMKRPARPAELDHYDLFVGDWNWNATSTGPDGAEWTGTARWEWTLDRRCLHGVMQSQSGDTSFEAAGVWSWHPHRKQYIWWMFNNWGYPQEGTARYNEDRREWCMDYESVGLDGTTSHGRYVISVENEDRLGFRMTEWADPLHTIVKVQLEGAYTRAE